MGSQPTSSALPTIPLAYTVLELCPLCSPDHQDHGGTPEAWVGLTGHQLLEQISCEASLCLQPEEAQGQGLPLPVPRKHSHSLEVGLLRVHSLLDLRVPHTSSPTPGGCRLSLVTSKALAMSASRPFYTHRKMFLGNFQFIGTSGCTALRRREGPELPQQQPHDSWV